MKILFVSSGNLETEISPIVSAQAKSLTKAGLLVDHFVIKGKGALGYFGNVPILKRKLREGNYQVIHAHFGYCGIVSQLARTNEKLIVSFMGDDLLAPKNIDGSKKMFGQFMVSINKRFAKKYDFNIVKTEEMAKSLSSKFLKVIPNGVDMELFKPSDKVQARMELKLNKDIFTILFAADPSRPEKNHPLAKAAFDLLAKTRNANLLEVHNRTQEELSMYYNAADVLILTSFHEGSPNVVKEAMACNLPIVSVAVGDVRLLIENTDGCFVAENTPEHLCQCLNQVAENDRPSNGRDSISHLKEDMVAKQIITIYEKMLSR